MFKSGLKKRRHIIKTSMGVTIPNDDGPAVKMRIEIQIVTYGCTRSLIAWFAEGLCDTQIWVGPLNGDKMYRAIEQDVRRAYQWDSDVSTR